MKQHYVPNILYFEKNSRFIKHNFLYFLLYCLMYKNSWLTNAHVYLQPKPTANALSITNFVDRNTCIYLVLFKVTTAIQKKKSSRGIFS